MRSFVKKTPPKRRGPFGKLKRRSISIELTISLVLLVLLFEGILLGVVYHIQYRSYEQELQALADSYTENLAQVLAVPLWDYDDEQIAKIGIGYIHNQLVDEVRIVDADGNILFQENKGTAGYQRVERHGEIVHRGQTIGRVELYLSPREHTTRLVWLRNVIVLILAASLIAILVTTGILLRIFMRKPLKILKEGIDRVARGDDDYGFDEVRHSELSDIAGRFRDMADTVRDRERSLQQQITERQRAERKIRDSEAKSRALLDAIPDLMFRLDRRGTFLEFKGDHHLLAAAPSQFLGQNIADILPIEIASAALKHAEKAILRRQIQVFEYELEIKSERRHFESRLVAVTNEQVVAIVREITERIKAAAEREQLEERLRRAHKMEAIGMLAGGVAHDLNNVLSGVVSYPELLLMDLPMDSPLRQPIRTIQTSGEKAANIVQDLLTLARRGVAVTEAVRLNDLICEFQKSPEFQKLTSDQPDFELKLELDESLLNTTGSPVQLFKTIMNLVANGVEAITGQGIIKIQTYNHYVDKPLKGYDDIAPGDYVVMTVSDNGVGISPKDIDRIFEPFYTKKIMGRSGTGLGMAVVWGTIKDHHGYIEVDSQVGQGTRITVYLPASRQEAIPQRSLESVDQFKSRGETILVVDDMPEQLEIASQMLEKLGYRVVTAASGQAAVNYLSKHTADLLILDMIMEPGMDGLETYRQVIKIRPGQKAIIASGYSETDRVFTAQALGAGAYIKKPYLLETVGRVVRNELDS
jgi:signal transduction histidine kinase/CheY-like chemotaxis protein